MHCHTTATGTPWPLPLAPCVHALRLVPGYMTLPHKVYVVARHQPGEACPSFHTMQV